MVWAKTLGSFGAQYAQKDPRVLAPTNCAIKSYLLPRLTSRLAVLTLLAIICVARRQTVSFDPSHGLG
jgi:hypothetical protein